MYDRRVRARVAVAQPPQENRRLLSGGALLLVSLAVLLLLSGCTPQQVRAFSIQPEVGAEALTSGNRLVVQSYDGNIFTVAPDGSSRIQVTDDADRRRQYQQPTWAPDGATLALSRVDDAGSMMVGAVVVTGYDGKVQSEIPVPFPPFYLYWNPSGERLAYLSSWQGLEGPSMVLRLVNTVSGVVDTVAEGSPYYFSWSPSGDELVAHVSERRLELQTLDGTRTSLAVTGGGFGAPQWSADGSSLMYGLVDAEGGHLVVGDTAGVPLREVTTFDERISFQLNAAGDQVAYVLTPSGAAANTLGPLYVTEVESGRTRQLSDSPVWAFYWSPDGEKLAYLSTDIRDGEYALRWSVWDGERRTDYASFLPTRTLLERYLVYSDQYAQSMRIWSPESDAFVYAGTSESGRQGIWVQKLGEAEPGWVAGGVMSSWSPR